MIQISRSRNAGDAGSVLAEFAAALPFMWAMVIGIIDYGYGLRDAQLMAQASKAGARAASRLMSTATPTCDDLRAEAASFARLHLSRSGARESNFAIDPAIISTIVQDGASFSVINLTIRRPTLSLFAGQPFVAALPEFRVESSFRLERPITCS